MTSVLPGSEPAGLASGIGHWSYLVNEAFEFECGHCGGGFVYRLLQEAGEFVDMDRVVADAFEQGGFGRILRELFGQLRLAFDGSHVEFIEHVLGASDEFTQAPLDDVVRPADCSEVICPGTANTSRP